MNSNMKAGILISFFVIIVFVFVIGKWPALQNTGGEGEPAQTLMNPQLDQPGLGAMGRQTQHSAAQFQRAAEEELAFVNQQTGQQGNSSTNAEVRIILPIPENLGPALQPADLAATRDQTPQLPPVPAWPKSHMVEPGDNLALIAKHYYGPVAGNKKSTISKLFAANRRVLKTADQLQVGQTLSIPALSPWAGRTLETVTVPARGMGGTLPNQTESSQQPPGQWYVVREGDSLWKIANRELGNGELYHRIAKLNDGIIEDEDNLPVGLRLRLPVL